MMSLNQWSKQSIKIKQASLLLTLFESNQQGGICRMWLSPPHLHIQLLDNFNDNVVTFTSAYQLYKLSWAMDDKC